MSDSYQPLFNRTYLKIIMWCSAFAVLYLATMGNQEPEFPSLEQMAQKPVYLIDEDNDATELSLLLPTGSALSAGERQLQTLLAQVLQNRMDSQRLPSQLQYNVQQAADYVSLNLRWQGEEQAPDWQVLWQQLQAPVDITAWQPVLEKLKAREYLQSHKPEQQLLNTFFAQLTGGDHNTPLALLNSRYQQMLLQATYVVWGDERDAWAQRIVTALPEGVVSKPTPRSLITSGGEYQLPAGNDLRYYLLLGNSAPARADAQFVQHKLAAHTLLAAVQTVRKNLNFEYRQQWASLQDGGYGVLLLSAETPLNAVLSQVTQNLTEEQVSSSRNQLIRQWQERMTDPTLQRLALQQVAFYQLPLDTLRQYTEQLSETDTESVLTLARQRIEPAAQWQIRFK